MKRFLLQNIIYWRNILDGMEEKPFISGAFLIRFLRWTTSILPIVRFTPVFNLHASLVFKYLMFPYYVEFPVVYFPNRCLEASSSNVSKPSHVLNFYKFIVSFLLHQNMQNLRSESFWSNRVLFESQFFIICLTRRHFLITIALYMPVSEGNWKNTATRTQISSWPLEALNRRRFTVIPTTNDRWCNVKITSKSGTK